MAGRIKGITIELDGDTKGLDKALSDVNSKSRDVAKELRDVERLLKFNPGNTELVAQKQKLLGDQVKNTREKLDRLKEAEKQVQEQFEKGEISEEQYRAFQREIAETESKLKHYESQIETTQDKLDRFGEKTKEVGEAFKNAGDKMKSAGKSLTTKVTAPILGIATAAAKVGSDFEAGMSEVAAISGATGDDLSDLQEKAREMGATTKFSATESAEAMKYMALAGWETTDMLDGIAGIMDLAAASGEDLGQVSDIVTDGLSAFGLQAEESGRMADVLAAASANANTDVSGLGAAFQYVAPVAGALGFTMEDTSKAIGLMANSGIKGQKAGTGLRTMMTNLAKPTAAMEEQMEELGISLTDSSGEMKSFDEIMGDMRGSFKDLSEEQQANAAATIFGKEAMSGALAIINATEEDFNSLGEAINNSEGAASAMAEVMQDNLQGRLLELKSKLEDVAITIYENLQPALEKMIEFVTQIVEWFQNLSPETQNLIMIIAALAAAIGPILIVLGVLASSIGSIITVVGTIIPLLGTLGTVFTVLTGPVGIVIAIIAALIAIGVALYKNWDKIKTKTIEVWNSIKSFFSNVWSNIKSIFGSALNWLDSKTGGNFSKILNVVMRYMNMVWNNIKSIWDYIKRTFTNALNLVKSIVTGDFEGIKNAISDQMENAKKLIEDIWNNVMDFFNGIDLKQVGIDMIQGLISGIGSMAGALVDKAKGVVDGAINGAKKLLGIKSPSRVFMDIGDNTAQGLIDGLSSMGGKVKKASEDMTANTIIKQEKSRPIIKTDNKLLSEIIKQNDLLMQLISKETVIEMDSRTVGKLTSRTTNEELNNINNRNMAAWGGR